MNRHRRAQLGQYLDGTLGQSERDAVAAHLGVCAACRAELEQLESETRQMRALLRDVAPIDAPAALRVNVRAALQNEAAARQSDWERRAKSGRAHRAPQWNLPGRSWAWLGGATFAAVALWALAQPFAPPLNAPQTAPIANSELRPVSPAPRALKAPRSAPIHPTAPRLAPVQSPQRANASANAAPANAAPANAAPARALRSSSASQDSPARPPLVKSRPNAVRPDTLSQAPRRMPVAPVAPPSATEAAPKALGAAAVASKDAPKPRVSGQKAMRAEVGAATSRALARGAAPRAATIGDAKPRAQAMRRDMPLPAPVAGPSDASQENAASRIEALEARRSLSVLEARAAVAARSGAQSNEENRSVNRPAMLAPRFAFALQAVETPRQDSTTRGGALLPAPPGAVGAGKVGVAEPSPTEEQRFTENANKPRSDLRAAGAPGAAPRLQSPASASAALPSRAPYFALGQRGRASAGSGEPGGAAANDAVAASNETAVTAAGGAAARGVLGNAENGVGVLRRDFLAPRATRLRLRFTAPRDVAGAQIRIVLPLMLRFTAADASNSRVVWRGDLRAASPVTVEFSLLGARGGEKISVAVEQNVAAAQSKPLEVQTLLVP